MDFISISEIEMFADSLDCSKDRYCCKTHFPDICKVEDIGLQHSLVCRDSRPHTNACVCAVPFGDRHFCRCPVLIHIVRKYRK